jgi:hypothetical protein
MIKLHIETERQTANGLKKNQIDYFDLLYKVKSKDWFSLRQEGVHQYVSTASGLRQVCAGDSDKKDCLVRIFNVFINKYSVKRVFIIGICYYEMSSS